MEYKTRQVALQGKHGGTVVGWVRPMMSEAEEASLRERLFRRRCEHLEEYLARIDECLRELSELGAMDVDTMNAVDEARATVRKLHLVRRATSRSP